MENFDTIYKQYYPLMYRVGYKMLGDNDVVADVIQEVFVYLYEKLSKGEQVTFLKSWLYRVTYNKCVDCIKKQKPFVSIEGVVLPESECSKELDAIREMIVKKALGLLSERDRFLVVMYSEGLSYKEIADAAMINVNSVGKTLARALKKIEVELKKEYHEML